MAADLIFDGWADQWGNPNFSEADCARIQRLLLSFGQPGEDGEPVRIEAIFRKKRKHRSKDQNAYWWAVPIPLIAERCGFLEAEDCHNAMLQKHGKKIPNPVKGQDPIIIGTSDTRFTTKDFSDMIEKVIIWAAAFLDLEIPYPNERGYEIG